MKTSFRIMLFAAAGLALAGCETVSNLNPFGEKDKKLEGDRRPVFPPGDPLHGPQKLPPPGSDASTPTIPVAPDATQ